MKLWIELAELVVVVFLLQEVGKILQFVLVLWLEQ